jgi:hypothetical protein
MAKTVYLARYGIFYLLVTVFSVGTVRAADSRQVFHHINVFCIEATGVYAGVNSLLDKNSGPVTRAAAITNFALLGTNGSLGLVTLLSSGEQREKLHLIHRIRGYTIVAASAWLSISSSIDGCDGATRAVSYTYSGLTIVPVFTFLF